MIPLGKVEKMIIMAYTGPITTPDHFVGKYEFLVNPESYNHRYQIDEIVSNPPGDNPPPPQYLGQPPAEWEFDILIDGTGVIKEASVLDISLLGNIPEVKVEDKVEQLRKLAAISNGEIHKPNYLKVLWGDRPVFKGSLISLDLNYKLFKTNGTPLRVIAKLKLREWNIDRHREDPFSSPDITHERLITSSDKFDLMAFKIYNDPKYYIDVAISNKLNSFRRISIGTKLNFPPIK